MTPDELRIFQQVYDILYPNRIEGHYLEIRKASVNFFVGLKKLAPSIGDEAKKLVLTMLIQTYQENDKLYEVTCTTLANALTKLYVGELQQ